MLGQLGLSASDVFRRNDRANKPLGLTGEEPETAVRLGWAHGALVTSYPGDTTMATVEQVRAFAEGGSARIQR